MAKEYKKPTSLKDIKTPLHQGFNSTLVKQAGLTSKYSGGDSYAGYGEIDVDKMMDPLKEALGLKMKNKEKKNKGKGKGKGSGSGSSSDSHDTYNTYNNGGTGGTGDTPPGPIGGTPPVTPVVDGNDPIVKEEEDTSGGDPTAKKCTCEGLEGLDATDPKCKCEESGGADTDEDPKEGDPCDCEPLDCVPPPGERTASYDGSMLGPNAAKGAGKLDANGNCVGCPTCEDAKKSMTSQKEFEKCREQNGEWSQKCQCCTFPGEDPCCPEESTSGAEDPCKDCPDGLGGTPIGDGECDCNTVEPKKKEESSKEEKTNEEETETLFQQGYGPKALFKENRGNLQTQNTLNGVLSSTDMKFDKSNTRSFKQAVNNGAGDYSKYKTQVTGKNIENGNKQLTGYQSSGNVIIGGKSLKTKANFTYANIGNDGIPTEVALEINLPCFSEEYGSGSNANMKKIKASMNRTMNAGEFKKFATNQANLVNEAKTIIKGCRSAGEDFTGRKATYKKSECLRKSLSYEHNAALSLKNTGFFDNAAYTFISSPPPPGKFKSPINHGSTEDFQYGRNGHNPDIMEGKHEDWHGDKATAEKRGEEFNTPPPAKFRSPFPQRDRSHLNVRKKWKPTKQQPMMYRSPLHQDMEMDPNQDPMASQDPMVQNPEEMAGVEGQEMQPQTETVWDKMSMYGDGLKTQVDKFVSNASYNPEVDKPIKAIQNQEWVGRITEWLKEKKDLLVQARKSKDKKGEQDINQHVQALIGDVTTYAGKFQGWIDRNGGDQTPGNKGGNMTSEGSSKDKRFEGDLAFVGDTNTDMDITDEGKIGIKSYGLEDLKYVEELDNDVFMKDFKGYQQMLEMSAQLQEDAESGRPMNKNIIGGQADLLLANKDSLLSWAHDPLYGQAWVQDFAKGNPNENLDWAMPESEEFDKDRLEDEVHGWLTDKLTQAYTKYAPKDVKDADGIQNETMANIKQGGYSKNTPIAFKQTKTKAQQLIAKYS